MRWIMFPVPHLFDHIQETFLLILCVGLHHKQNNYFNDAVLVNYLVIFVYIYTHYSPVILQVKNIAMEVLDFYDSHKQITEDRVNAAMNKLAR